MNNQRYKLVNTNTGKTIKRVTLNAREASTFNYAYALNGSVLRYRLV